MYSLTNCPVRCPRPQPIKMPGKNNPAGTEVPYVRIVKMYQKSVKITSVGASMKSVRCIKILMMVPSVLKKSEARPLN